MASYKYEVVGADGKPKTGTIEAMNMEVASAELKSGGNTIVSIARANAFNKDLEIHIGKAVSVREMSVFCRQFESVLNAGVTVVEALDMLSEQTENKPFANAIAEVRDSVQRGDPRRCDGGAPEDFSEPHGADGCRRGILRWTG